MEHRWPEEPISSEQRAFADLNGLEYDPSCTACGVRASYLKTMGSSVSALDCPTAQGPGTVGDFIYRLSTLPHEVNLEFATRGGLLHRHAPLLIDGESCRWVQVTLRPITPLEDTVQVVCTRCDGTGKVVGRLHESPRPRMNCEYCNGVGSTLVPPSINLQTLRSDLITLRDACLGAAGGGFDPDGAVILSHAIRWLHFKQHGKPYEPPSD